MSVSKVVSTKKYFFAELIIRQAIRVFATKHSLSFLVGPFNFFFVWIGTKVLSFILHETILGASVLYRNFQTDQEMDDYMKAVEEAEKNMKNKKLTKEQQDELEQAVMEATQRFIRLRGVRKL